MHVQHVLEYSSIVYKLVLRVSLSQGEREFGCDCADKFEELEFEVDANIR